MLTNRIGNTSLLNSRDVIKNSDVSDYVELLKPRVCLLYTSPSQRARG